MNLPNAINAVVERSKIADYILASDHPEGTGKAGFFTRFGFTADEWQGLAKALVVHAGANPVSSTSVSKYGTKYQVDGPLVTPDGRCPEIRAIWIIEWGAAKPRLVTAYPL